MKFSFDGTGPYQFARLSRIFRQWFESWPGEPADVEVCHTNGSSGSQESTFGLYFHMQAAAEVQHERDGDAFEAACSVFHFRAEYFDRQAWFIYVLTVYQAWLDQHDPIHRQAGLWIDAVRLEQDVAVAIHFDAEVGRHSLQAGCRISCDAA